MTNFPSYPKLESTGLKLQSAQSVLRTTTEDGMVKQLKWRAKTLRKRPLTYSLDTLANRNSFQVYVDTTLNMGADWFTWTDPVDNVAKTARIVKGSEGVTYTPRSGNLVYWSATFELETYE